MIRTGQYQQLQILRETPPGVFLGDDQAEEVLLPNKYVPESFEIGEEIEVFVYRDHEDRKIATTLHPKIRMHEFALLKVKEVTKVGAFLDWGLEKDLMVPFSAQQKPMKEGRWYVVYLDLDEKTDRLFATNRFGKILNNDNMDLKVGQEVDILVLRKSDAGYNVIVNQKHHGLIFENEVFKELNVGDKHTAFVKKIRSDQKLDISLQAIGYSKYSDVNAEKIIKALKKNDGFLNFTDKSKPEDIYQHFGISKKAFKKALGGLYKSRKVKLEKEGIRFLSPDS